MSIAQRWRTKMLEVWRKLDWGCVVCLSFIILTTFSIGITMSTFSETIVPMTKEFNGSLSLIALSGATPLSIEMLGAPLAFFIHYQMGGRSWRLMIFAGVCLQSFALFSMYFVQNAFSMFLLLGLIGGAGMMFTNNTPFLLLAEYYPRDHPWHAFTTSIAACAYPLATLIFNPITYDILASIGWRATYAVLAGTLLVVGCITSLAFRSPTSEDSDSTNISTKKVESSGYCSYGGGFFQKGADRPTETKPLLKKEPYQKCDQQQMKQDVNQKKQQQDGEQKQLQQHLQHEHHKEQQQEQQQEEEEQKQEQQQDDGQAGKQEEKHIQLQQQQQQQIISQQQQKHEPAEAKDKTSFKIDERQLLLSMRMMIVAAIFVCGFLVNIGYFVVIIFFVKHVVAMGVPQELASRMMIVIGLSEFLVRLLVTSIGGCLKGHLLSLYIFCAAVLCLSSMLAIFASTFAHFLTASIAICIFEGPIFALLFSFSSELLDGRMTATLFSSARAGCGFAFFVVPPILGAILDVTDSYQWMYIISSISYGITLIIFIIAKFFVFVV